jgi:spore germination protein GerM
MQTRPLLIWIVFALSACSLGPAPQAPPPLEGISATRVARTSARATATVPAAEAPVSEPTAAAGAASTVDPPVSTATVTAVSAESDPQSVLNVYFPRMDSQGSVTLIRVERLVASSERTAASAVARFVAGPSGDERATDVGVALHRSTNVHSVEVRDGVAIVDFGPNVQRVAGKPWVEAVYWSLVLTVLDVPGVESLQLRVDGQPLQQLGYPPYPVDVCARGDAAPFPVQSWEGPRT